MSGNVRLTRDFYHTLKELIPNIPCHCTGLTIKMTKDSLVEVTATFWANQPPKPNDKPVEKRYFLTEFEGVDIKPE